MKIWISLSLTVSRLRVTDGMNSLGSRHSYSWDLPTFIPAEVGRDCGNSDIADIGHLKWQLWQIQLLLRLWQMQSFSSIPSINCWSNNFPSTLLPPYDLSFCVSSLSLAAPGQHTSRLPVACPYWSDHLLSAANMPVLASLLPGACAIWPLMIVWKHFMPINLHAWKVIPQKPLTTYNSFLDKPLIEMPTQIWLEFDCGLSLWLLPPHLLLWSPFVPYLTNLSLT